MWLGKSVGWCNCDKFWYNRIINQKPYRGICTKFDMGNLTNMVGGSESFRTGDILKIAVLMHHEDKSVVKCQYAGCGGKTIYNMFAQFVCVFTNEGGEETRRAA